MTRSFPDQIVSLFLGGTAGFGSYRIPAILTSLKGTILAFCEARQELNDHAQNKVVLKRSFDCGRSWGDLQLVADAGRDALNNPLIVQERVTGRIILMFQRYAFTKATELENPDKWISHATQNFPPNIHEGSVVSGYDGRICRTFMSVSTSDGESWSELAEITQSVKKPEATNYAGGPGIGMQIRLGESKGRLLMPFSQGPWGKQKVYSVFSDDQGENWHAGHCAPSDTSALPGEVQMVELSDGKIMLNSRSFQGNKCRLTALSSDGGISWSTLKDDPQLIEPECQGSIIGFSSHEEGSQKVLLFSNPCSRDDRQNGMLKVSYDDGKTWSDNNSIYGGSFGYSCLTVLPDGNIGVLFERDGYSKISFSTIDRKSIVSLS